MLRALTFLLLAPALVAQTAIISPQDIVQPVVAEKAMVVASEPLAAQAGLAVLKAGGNAVDAAVTIGFVLAVTLPRAGNLGGGGFMLLHSVAGESQLIDYRETAPAAASRDMYLDSQGNPDATLSRFSHLAVGVPGTVAGLAKALAAQGSISLAEALAPAIRLAREGFPMPASLARDLESRRERLFANSAVRAAFFKPDGSSYAVGETFRQPDLARTLQAIADAGPAGFYRGAFARALASEMKANGGLISEADMADYQAIVRQPVSGSYRGYRIISTPPPSSGGIHILQILNILEGEDLRSSGHNSAATIHRMAESMKLAYADRSKYLGDPGFARIPQAGLISKAYAAELRAKIAKTARPSAEIHPGEPPGYESNETTHFSVVDAAGNAVSNTYTLNFSFGCGIMVPSTGVLLNNEMDDFSAKPGVPNAYGLVGGEANAVAPGKRMLSSMSPTIVLKDGKVFLVTGTPGGARIITTNVQIILNLIDHQMNIQEAVNAPRMHHQWLPDELRIESGISPDTLDLLRTRGHKISLGNTMGAASSIMIDPSSGWRYGAADPRRNGLAVGY